LKALKDKVQVSFNKKLALEQSAAKTKKKINTARSLISSLSGERDRWGTESS
jgi:hypothetical protein